MNKKVIISVIIIAIILLIAIFTFNLTGYNTLGKNNEIVLGAILPLSGPAADYGLDLQGSFNLAVDEINDQGGINGKNIRIIFEDGKASAKDALTAAQKLINIDNVDIIIGGISSSETLGAAPYAEEQKVILLSPTSTNPEITYSGDYIFRTAPSDAHQGKIIAQVMINNNHKNIALLSAQDSDFSQGIRNVFVKEFNILNGNILIEEKYVSNDLDLKTQITKIQNINPEAIYIIADTTDSFNQILKQFKEFNIDKQLYTISAMLTEDILNKYGDYLDQTILASPKFDEDRQEIIDFKNKLKNYNKNPFLPIFFHASVYDDIYIIKEAIEECKSTNTDCIKKELYSIKNRNGLLPNLSIDKYGDAVLEYNLKIIENGSLEDFN